MEVLFSKKLILILVDQQLSGKMGMPLVTKLQLKLVISMNERTFHIRTIIE